jgi:hypothetical protein
VWQARVRRRGYPPQTCTFDTKAKAEAWAATVESEMARGVFVSRAEAENTTLGEALDRYVIEIVPRKKNAAREACRCSQMKTHPLARHPLASIRGKDVAAFIHERQAKGAGANTVRLDLALLSHVFEMCRTAWGMEGVVNPVPLAKSARPKLPRGLTAGKSRISSVLPWKPRCAGARSRP